MRAKKFAPNATHKMPKFGIWYMNIYDPEEPMKYWYRVLKVQRPVAVGHANKLTLK